VCADCGTRASESRTSERANATAATAIATSTAQATATRQGCVLEELTMLTINEVDVAGRLRPVLLKLARELRREVADLGVSAGQATLLVSIKRQPGIA